MERNNRICLFDFEKSSDPEKFPTELKEFFKEYEKHFKEYESLKDAIIKKKAEGNSNEIVTELSELKEAISEKREDLENEKSAIIDYIAEYITKGKFTIELGTSKVKGFDVVMARNAYVGIVSRLITQDLNRTYHASVSNRDLIIEQLRGLIDNPSPKVIIRTDVKSFFESIPQDRLLKKLHEDDYLQQRTLKYLRTFFYRYNELTNCEDRVGIPRGLSFSSSLAEIYMRRIDAKIREHEEVIFYQRYVDDIVMVCSCGVDTRKMKGDLIAIFKDEGLVIHSDDEKFYLKTISKDDLIFDFEYLGYRFTSSGDGLVVKLSDHRMRKYKARIRGVFEVYKKCSQYRAHKSTENPGRKKSDALAQLIRELKVLTGNGTLYGYKKNVATGVYYSNRHLTTLIQLEELDEYMHAAINNPDTYPKSKRIFVYKDGDSKEENVQRIKERLMRFSFVEGYEKRKVVAGKAYISTLRRIKRIGAKYLNDEKISFDTEI